MAEDVKTQDEHTTTAEAAQTTSAPAIDPNEYNQLKQYYEKTAPFLQKAAPLYDEINEFVDDPELRTFYKTAKESYQSLKTKSNAVPDELRPVVDRLDRFEKTFDEYNATLRAQQERERQAALQPAMELIARQKAEHPELDSPEGNEFFVSIGNWAAKRNISYEQAYKEYTGKLGLYREQAPQAPTPPRSLRPAATEPGVSSDRTPTIKNKKDFSNYLRRTLGKAAR